MENLKPSHNFAGTEEDVSEIVKYGDTGEAGIKQLSSMMTVLKREYNKALEDKKSMRNENRDLNMQLIVAKANASEVKEELKNIRLQLKESNQAVADLEQANNNNRRKVAHLRHALKRNKTEGSQSFVAAINEESPNVAYTPPLSFTPPPPEQQPYSLLQKQPPLPLSTQHQTSASNGDINDSKSKEECHSPDLFEQSIVDENDMDEKVDDVTSKSLKKPKFHPVCDENKKDLHESAPSVLKMIHITSAAERFQAAKLRKIELEKDFGPKIPYSNFSIMQKKLTGISSSRPANLLKSNIGLPPSRTYNGLGGSCKIEDPFETPFRRGPKFFKMKASKQRCPLASKPIPNQPKLKSCLQRVTSTPCISSSSFSYKSDESVVSSAAIANISPIKKSSSSVLGNKNNKNKVNTVFAKSTSAAVKEPWKNKASTSSIPATLSLHRPDDGVIDLT